MMKMYPILVAARDEKSSSQPRPRQSLLSALGRLLGFSKAPALA